MEYLTHPVLTASPEMLMELALGLDTFENICRRYEYDDASIAALKQDRGTATKIKRLEAELQKDGVTLKHRASYALEDLIGVIWQRAKRSDTNLDLTIKSAKLLAEVSGVTSQNAQQGQSGGGVTISITIPGIEQKTISEGKNTIDVTPEHVFTVQETPSRNAALALPDDWDEA